MNTHPIRIVPLVEGILFLGAAGLWALATADVVDLSELHWLVPVLLILAGTAGLTATVVSGTRRSRRLDEPDGYDEGVGLPSAAYQTGGTDGSDQADQSDQAEPGHEQTQRLPTTEEDR